MNSSDAIGYDNILVREVFNVLSIDKSRLPSSGLTVIGIPSFVAEWLLDKIVPGTGALTSLELEKVNNFVKKAFPRKDDRNEIIFDLTQGEVHKLIALMQVRVKLDRSSGAIPDPFARIPVINLNECSIPTDLIERNKMLLRQGVWGKISISMRSDGNVEL